MVRDIGTAQYCNVVVPDMIQALYLNVADLLYCGGHEFHVREWCVEHGTAQYGAVLCGTVQYVVEQYRRALCITKKGMRVLVED